MNKLMGKVITYLSNKYATQTLISNSRLPGQFKYIQQNLSLGWLSVNDLLSFYDKSRKVKFLLRLAIQRKHLTESLIKHHKDLINSIKSNINNIKDPWEVDESNQNKFVKVLGLASLTTLDGQKGKYDNDLKGINKDIITLRRRKNILGKLNHFKRILIEHDINPDKIKVFGHWDFELYNNMLDNEKVYKRVMVELNILISYAIIILVKHPDYELATD